MSSALNFSALADRDGPSLRRRAISLALAILANLLIFIALLTLNGPALQRPQFKGGPILLDLSPEAETAPEVQREKAVTEPSGQPEPQPVASVPLPPPPVQPPPLPSDNPLPFIVFTKEEFAAADISKLGVARGAAPGATQPASAAGDSETIGTAPNGEPLYRAEWHRRPTRAELSAYLPNPMPKEGWGLVACKTIERYQVDDCVELGNSPPGSHLAGAVRKAAWQFRVRPPRVGGKELVGTWVRIRIDYSQDAEE